MAEFLAGIEIDFISFAIGFAAGAMFWWLFLRLRPSLSKVWAIVAERFTRVRRGLGTPVDKRYRVDAYKIYGANHLAEPLFSMQEVAVPPRLISPPPPVIPGEALPPEAITDIAVPYMPDLPEVGGQFKVKTITIPEAMSKGGNLLLFGPPGSGRTFAACHLACQAALKDPAAGTLSELIPFYVHVGGLDLSKPDQPVDLIYNYLANKVSIMVEAALKDLVRNILAAKNALVIVDGLDELPPSERPPVIEFVKNLQDNYPGNRYILISSPDDLSAQTPLKLFPFAVAGWGAEEKGEFLHRWGELWQEHIPDQGWAKRLPEIFDPIVLNAWLHQDTHFSSPFDVTLKAWAAYAGDSRGRSETAAIEAYLARMSAGIVNARPAMENLAAQSILNATPFLRRRTAAGYIKSFEQFPDDEEALAAEAGAEEAIPEAALAGATLSDEDLDSLIEEVSALPSATAMSAEREPDLEVDLDADLDAMLDELDELVPEEEPEAETVVDAANEPEQSTVRPSGRTLLPQLTDARLLVEYPNGRFGFIHPIFAGFLAGANLTTTEALRALNEQPNWTGKLLAQRFMPFYQADMAPFLAQAIQQAKASPLQLQLVEASSWLRYVSGNPAWRTGFMRSLAANLQDDGLPMGLRARLLTHLVFSGVPGVSKLLKQMLRSPLHSVRWLGALGAGLIRDPALLEDLTLLLYESSVFVSQAACLALATYGDQRALEALTRALLEGDDNVRRAAAEALAMHPEEGHPVLKDGAVVEDVAVRRAVVFGLARVKEDWAEKILLELQTGDEQWVVRNAAIQIIEDMKLDAISIPTQMPPLHESAWLVRYASEKGMGLSPGQASWDLLAEALKTGVEETQMAAMYIYRRKPEESYMVIEPLVELMRDRGGEIREAAYTTLWHLQANKVAVAG